MSDIVAGTRPRGPTTDLALWVLQALLAFQFAGGGLLKLTGSPEMVDLFATIGAGQWLRYLVGPPPTCSSSASARGCRSASGSWGGFRSPSSS